jgi:hypothetical protein
MSAMMSIALSLVLASLALAASTPLRAPVLARLSRLIGP